MKLPLTYRETDMLGYDCIGIFDSEDTLICTSPGIYDGCEEEMEFIVKACTNYVSSN